MRTADIVTASLLTALGLLVLNEAVRLGFRWGPDGPQSGFFPFWLSLILIGHSVAIVVRAIRRRSEKPFVEREQLRSVLTVAVPAAAMVLLTQFIGLYLASALYLGFYVAITPFNLLMAVVGITLGTIIGVLPGLGGANGVAILLPLTFRMPPTSAIILLTSLYWGALFGGAITSVLFNIPGEPWSVAT